MPPIDCRFMVAEANQTKNGNVGREKLRGSVYKSIKVAAAGVLWSEVVFAAPLVVPALHRTEQVARRDDHAADSFRLSQVTLDQIKPGLGVIPVPI